MLKRILVIRLSALGDVAMTLPVVYSLARQYPRLQIDILTRSGFAPLFADKPENIRLHTPELQGRHKGLIGMCRLLKELRALHPDGVADLHNVARSWLIDAFFVLAGKRVAMVDKMRADRRRVLRGQGRQPNFVERYADVFARLGFPVRLDFRSVFSSPRQPVVPVRHPAIGIAPFARYANKTYPVEQMRQVAELLARDGYHVYLFGGRQEARLLEQWQSETGRCTSLAGRFSLSDELSLLSCMDVVLAMDSANQHLASAVGTRVVTVWGSTTPACGFLGYGQREADALCLHLPCQPCSIGGSRKCKLHNRACLRQITPEAIATKIKQLI